MARSYHRACGRTFGSVSAFDRHLRLLRVPPWVECVDPEAVGLTVKAAIWRSEARKDGEGYGPTERGAIGVSSADANA